MFVRPCLSSLVSFFIILIFFVMIQFILPLELQFFSFFSLLSTGEQGSLFPLFLIIGLSLFLQAKIRGGFYFISFLMMLILHGHGLYYLSFFISFVIGFFLVNKLGPKNTLLNILLLFVCLIISAFSIYTLTHQKNFSVIAIFLVLTWNLKIFSWVVTVRIYEIKYSFTEFLDYFFNPVFYFYTNDLNVLTPRRYLSSIDEGRYTITKNVSCFVLGLGLLILYGCIQKYFFKNAQINNHLIFYAFVGAISLVTAIIFHWGNSAMQVSLLNILGYKLDVDMSRPWLAQGPIDYWKRMHYYVRDYFLEIITKPTFIFLKRNNISHQFVYFSVLICLYLLFITNQMGFQPYRAYKGFDVSVLISSLFAILLFFPVFLEANYPRIRWKMNRFVLFFILSIGYTFIYYFRKGF